MKTNRDIVIVGSSNTDMTIRNSRLPVPGGIVAGGQFTMSSGGKGANQAVAVARMGGKVTFITKTGNDLFGMQAKQKYRAEGICTDYVFSDPDHPSGVALIMTDDSGAKFISIAQGSIRYLSPQDIEKARPVIEKAGFVMIELEISQETAKYVADMAGESGATVILNPSPIQFIAPELLRSVDVIIPNRTEAEMLTGIHVGDVKSAEKAAERISSQGVRTVIVTMGSQGALIYDKGVTCHVPAFKVNAVDTQAAGDTFCGTFCVGLSEGMSLEQASIKACKAAAIKVTRSGGQDSIPYRSEL